MAFTGRPKVTNAERKRMEGFLDASGPKRLMLMAIEQILKAPVKKQLSRTLTTGVIPSSKSDTNFDKWQKKNRGMTGD